jgi:peptidoglycan glycosyltransferase
LNQPIVRIYSLLLVLFAGLVWFTSRWSVFDADELREKPENRRPLIEEQQIERGLIRTADGVVVAESFPQGGRREPVYVRRYEQGELFGHPVGYSFVDVGRSGIELSENDVLVGEENEFTSIIDQIRGTTQEGSDLTLTIDAEAQRVATQGIQSKISIPGTGGALVAIEPATGAVRAMVSVPGLDSNTVQDEGEFQRLNQRRDSPVLNRPTQSAYPPGSTMKVVTAAAALDSGEFETSTTLDASSPKEISGVPLANFGGQSFGTIDMTTALTNSVNTYWAQVGEELGTETMVDYMKRFGFYSDPELDYPPDQMRASGVQSSDGDLVEEGFDVGRVAIGQGGEEGQALVTPIQMALAAAAIANGGELKEPTFVQEVTDPDGRTSDELGDGDVQNRVVSEEVAAEVTEMMTNVTREGTAAGLSVAGVEFAGKTGTAEKNIAEGLNQAWFIGFAPAQNPRIAVAATIESCTGCFGGDTAGPIATAVMETLLR